MTRTDQLVKREHKRK